MNFQKISMLVAGILLFVLFVLIAISYNHSNSTAIWPPIINNCPDYFLDVNGDGSSCLNQFSLGTAGTNIDFKNNNTSACQKFTYCNSNNLTWDGISYGYGLNNPCDSSS